MCGSRSIALLELTWPQIEFERRLINLGTGSGNKKRATVPMTKTVEKALKEAFQRRSECQHVIQYNGKPIKRIRGSFGRACARAGFPHVTPHALRHTAAVWMAEAGVPMSEISQYLGHTSTAITEKVYARYSPDYLRGAANHLEID